jgi:hypothetical protein
MVLPGIQALFGFQLVVVFSPGFGEKLSHGEQVVHLGALLLSAVAVAFIMAPAAFHRHKGPHHVTDTFVRVSTRLLLWSMLPLALSISTDCYVISRVILAASTPAAVIAGSLVAVFFALWVLLPRMRGIQRAFGGK